MYTCGANINSPDVKIVYPFSGNYKNLEYCKWIINAGVPIYIRLSMFEIENHKACAYDYLAIEVDRKRSRKYCGHKLPPVLTSSSGNVTFIFHADSATTRAGFVAWIGE